MQHSVIRVIRRDERSEDDHLEDDGNGDRRVMVNRVSVPLMLMDHAKDDGVEQRFDDRTREYLARNERLQNAWRHGRGAAVEVADRRVLVSDPAEQAYTEWKTQLSSQWRTRSGVRPPSVKDLPWQRMPAGSRKPRAGLANIGSSVSTPMVPASEYVRGDSAGDVEDMRHIDDERRATLADCEAVRRRANDDYVKRISEAYKKNRG